MRKSPKQDLYLHSLLILRFLSLKLMMRSIKVIFLKKFRKLKMDLLKQKLIPQFFRPLLIQKFLNLKWTAVLIKKSKKRKLNNQLRKKKIKRKRQKIFLP